MNDQAQPVFQDRAARSARFISHFYRYRSLLRKRWWVLALTVTVALGLQSYLIWGTAPGFVSVGRMIVNIRLQLPTGSAQYAEELSNFLGTQVALMKSDTVRNRALARLQSLKPTYLPLDLPLQITVSPKTTIFNLLATGPEPDYTRAYLEACMDEYINLKKEMRSQTSETTLAGIMEQLRDLEQQSKKGEQELLSFQSSNSVVLLQEQGGSAGSYLVSLNRQLAALRNKYQLLTMLSLDQNLELRRQKDTAGTTPDIKETGTSPEKLFGAASDYLKIKQEIQLRKADLQQLSEFFRPKHPDMVSLSEDIARAEKLLDILKEQSQEQLENRRNSLQLQVQNLERDYKETEAKSLDISRKMAKYQEIKANNERVQSLYRRLLDVMQTVGVGKDLDPESVVILERASVARPSRGNVAVNLTLATLVGLALGLGLLLLLDRFDDRPSSFTELEELFDEPILGQVPLEKVEDAKAGLQLLQPQDDRHGFVEAYRNLRSSLLYMATEGKRPKTIIVTSAVPGDGKSVTIANLAITMAQAGSRVLLVDADLRKGLLHRLFNVEASSGLHEVLSGKVNWMQAVAATSVPNLFLLPRGSLSRDPGELFLNQLADRFLQESGSQYDYVLLDSAPVMAADDVTSLAPRVEGLIFVIRAGCTSARVAHSALELLYQRKVDVLGLIFNGLEARAAEYYYYRYKDYYSKYPST